ncbi:hypothetical protein Tco_1579839, partial [Tanacetum coccineum]
MIGVTVGWSQGNIVMIGIIKTVQNHHLVMKDMKVQGELLMAMYLDSEAPLSSLVSVN